MSILVKIKELSLSKSRTVNLGNFNSARVECGLVAEIYSESAPTPEEVQDALTDLAAHIDFRLDEELEKDQD